MTQPDLFTVSPPPPKPNPVKVERERLNAAAERVLAFLKAHHGATNVTLSSPELGGLRFGGRLHELKAHGYVILKHHVSGGTWFYRLEKP